MLYMLYELLLDKLVVLLKESLSFLYVFSVLSTPVHFHVGQDIDG